MILSLQIEIDNIRDAHQFLLGHIEPTLLKPAHCIHDVYLKCENFQKTGSFKIRGALNKLRHLSAEEKQRGVVAASAGNHAQGVALSAKLFGVKATIVMPEGAPLTKVENTKELGAKVILHGSYFDQAFEKAREIEKETGAVFIHPYQDAHVIAGQGTIGLEILADLPEVDQVVVPIGGGGLISGISMAIKTQRPNCKIIGVVPQQTPGMKELKDGQPLSKKSRVRTIADGLAVKNPSPDMFSTYIDKYVDQIVSVDDEEIAEAIVHLIEKEKMIVEGSGAAGVAALLAGKVKPTKKTCVLLCGGNIDLNMMQSVLETGLRRKGRLTRVSVIVDDLPGSLARLTQVVAECRANTLDVMHDRVSSELALKETRIDFLLETTGFEHIQQIEERLRQEGVRILQAGDLA